MKLTSIVMTDARSWKDGNVLDLAPGFNVLVGESDCGKSNVVRNLRSLIENDTAGSLLNDGAAEAQVNVLTDGGVCVSLIKTADGSVNRYVIAHPKHDEVLDKVGATTSPAVTSALGLGPLPGVAASLHVGDQFEPRFCIADKPADVARTVSAACGIDAIVRAVASAGKDARAAKSEAKAAQQEAERARTAFAAMRARVAGLNAKERSAKIKEWEAEGDAWAHKAREALAVADGCQGLTAALRAAPVVEAAGNAIPRLDAALGQAEALLANAEEAAFAENSLRQSANAIKALEKLAASAAKDIKAAEIEIAYVEGLAGKCSKCGRVNL